MVNNIDTPFFSLLSCVPLHQRRNTQKWMTIASLAASLFGFAGCTLFGGLSSRRLSSQFAKSGIIYSDQTFGAVKLSLDDRCLS